MSHSRCTYSPAALLLTYIPALRPGPDVAARIRELGLWTVCYPSRRIRAAVGFGFARYRGCRSGQHVRRRQLLPLYRPVGNGASIIVGQSSVAESSVVAAVNHTSSDASLDPSRPPHAYYRSADVRQYQHPLDC